MAETFGLATPSHARPVRGTTRPSLEVQDEHALRAARIGPLAAPPPVILAGALAELSVFDDRPRHVEPISGAPRGRLV